MIGRPLFSICHTTARPEAWRKCYDLWMERAGRPEVVEYVLCIDERWGFNRDEEFPGVPADPQLAAWEAMRDGRNKLVWNTGRKCMVDGANIAAAASSGAILIINSDDMEPPQNWDDVLLMEAVEARDLDDDFVIQVSSGTKADDRGLMVLQILSRARYERYGYALYPDFTSMYADDDFTAQAVKDGAVIDATNLTFLHNHPFYEPIAKWDAVYEHENAATSAHHGRRIFDRRQNERAAADRAIAVCFPGETFSRIFKCYWSALEAHLIRRGFTVLPIYGEMSNPHGVRELLRGEALATGADLVLWIDDDQLLSIAQFEQLLSSLDSLPHFCFVAGWSWCDTETPVISCGSVEPDGVMPLPFSAMMTAAGLVEVGYTGFSAVLMRAETLRCDPLPFAPILAPLSRWGHTGEDVAFCANAKARLGASAFVDPKVFLPHLKVKALGLDGSAKSINRACVEADAQLHGRVEVRERESEAVMQ
jgi:hypothetical protein